MDRVDETTERIQIRGSVQSLIQRILRGCAVYVIPLNDPRTPGMKRRTHIIKRPLDVRHNAPIKGRKLPLGRLTVRTHQWNGQSQTTDLPISLCKKDKRRGFQFCCVHSMRTGCELTAVVMRILSGDMLEWIKRAEVWRKESPLHSWRIPFCI